MSNPSPPLITLILGTVSVEGYYLADVLAYLEEPWRSEFQAWIETETVVVDPSDPAHRKLCHRYDVARWFRQMRRMGENGQKYQSARGMGGK